MAVEDDLAEWIRPNRNDVRRAKRLVLGALASNPQWRTRDLVSNTLKTLGFPDLDPSMTIDLKVEALDRNARAVRAVRGTLAIQLALAELEVRGVILRAAMDGQETANPISTSVRFRMEDQFGSLNTENIPTGAASVASAYVMASLAAPGVPWYLDPDLLAEDTGGLQLNDRAKRALSEALDAYTRGLYLACASMLGVVSEAMWYEAANRLRASGYQSSSLDKAVANTATADVIERVGGAIEQEGKGLPGTTRSELVSHATLLRSLRNYGVHPAGEDDLLAKHFEEDTCGLLIARMATYPRQLGEAIEATEKGLSGAPHGEPAV